MKKKFLKKSEVLMGSSSTIVSSTLSVTKPGIGILIARSSALNTSMAILIKNDYISKSKIG